MKATIRSIAVSLLWANFPAASAYDLGAPSKSLASRRTFLDKVTSITSIGGVIGTGVLAQTLAPVGAAVAVDEEEFNVYFGCGW
jgi:hypothetical protein